MCFLFVFSMKEEIIRVYQYICHATELCLVLRVCLMILTVFFYGQGTEKKCRELFLVILLAVLHTLLQENASLLYFCEFHTMPSFYLEWRINHGRKVQLILSNYLKFPFQLSLLLLCSFICKDRLSRHLHIKLTIF